MTQDLDVLVRSYLAQTTHTIKSLGKVGNDDLLFLSPIGPTNGPRVLIAAGFHGEEPAGCWGLYEFFRHIDRSLLRSVNISLLPIVNPTGIRTGNRYNLWGGNPNDGFCHTSSGVPEPSLEGRILLDNLPRLLNASRDGFLSLHEDIDCTEFFLYTFEKALCPGRFTEALRRAELQHFRQMPDGEYDGGSIRDGVIFNHCDGSFEDLLFHQGVPLTACTETPGQLDFQERVRANVTICSAFVQYFINERE